MWQLGNKTRHRNRVPVQWWEREAGEEHYRTQINIIEREKAKPPELGV